MHHCFFFFVRNKSSTSLLAYQHFFKCPRYDYLYGYSQFSSAAFKYIFKISILIKSYIYINSLTNMTVCVCECMYLCFYEDLSNMNKTRDVFVKDMLCVRERAHVMFFERTHVMCL